MHKLYDNAARGKVQVCMAALRGLQSLQMGVLTLHLCGSSSTCLTLKLV